MIDLGKVGNVEACASALMAELHKRFEKTSADIILIERQPRARSIIMVAVQMFLCGFFSLPQYQFGKVKFISATWKLNMAQQHEHETSPVALGAAGTSGTSGRTRKGSKTAAERVKYSSNKKYAVMTAKHYLETVLCDFANLALLEVYPKKDDLADALLQALAFVEGSGSSVVKEFKRKQKVHGNKFRLGKKK